MAKRYQRDNQNQQIDEEQTIQWTKDIKGAIKISKSMKNRQYNGKKITKGCLFFVDLLILITPLVSFDH
jgi:CRISPR/Cas system CMR subunit Cmr4 (Cas7 group RAMP superfamily)